MNQEFKENEIIDVEYEENGVDMPQNTNNRFEISWQKTFSWVALALSCIIPLVALGLGIMCISSATENEKDEITVVSYIAIGIAAVLLFNSFILSKVLI